MAARAGISRHPTPRLDGADDGLAAFVDVDDGLAAFVDVDVFDADLLFTFAPMLIESK